MKNLIIIGGALAIGYYALKQHNSNPLNSLLMDHSVFPLKEGDHSIFVTNMQKALINKGGEVAQQILSSGGATGLFNAQTKKALEMCGYPSNISETHYRQLVNKSNEIRNIAYVIDVNGAELFAEVSTTYIPNYGYGRDLLIKLPAKNHLGTATGNYQNGMIELTTTINTQRKKFWVPTHKIALVSQQEYDSLKSTTILPKSDQAKMKLL